MEWEAATSIASLVAVALTVGGMCVTYGALKTKVTGNSDAHTKCEAKREEREIRLDRKLDEMSESLYKIKGALGINGE